MPSWIPVRLILYAMIGLVGTAVHYAVFLTLLASSASVLLASACGFVVGALINYVLNYRVTFRSTRRHREVAPRFFAVALFGLAVNMLVVATLTEWLLLRPLPAQLVATALCLVATYLLNSTWSFGATGDEAKRADGSHASA